MSISKKKMVWIGAILVLLCVLFFVFYVGKQEETNYMTTKVKTQTIENSVLADGVIKPAKLVSVGAQASGQIKTLKVKVGDQVTKGQAIAEIDDLTQRNALKGAKASLSSLKAQRQAKEANLKNAQLTYNRQKKLVAGKVGSQSDLDSALASLEVLKAEINALDSDIEKANISVDTAELDLGYTKITAPLDGVVVAIPVEEGQTLNAVQSAPTIVKIAQLDKMTVEAEISEADVVRINPEKNEVYFTILGLPDRKFDQLKLSSIKPGPESINNDDYLTSTTSSSGNAIYYHGLFDVDNPEGILRPSMTAQVHVVLDKAENAMTIPSTAIQKKIGDNKAIVYQIVNGAPVEKEITVGLDNNVNVQVLSGLNLDDEIVVGRLESAAQQTQGGLSKPKMR